MKAAGYDVVAIGARDYYEAAVALHERGMLARLLTDVYCPDRLRGRLGRRFNAALPARRTISLVLLAPLIALAAMIDRRFRSKTAWRLKADFAFGFAAALLNWLGPRQALVYSYYLEGFLAFYRLIGRRPDRLVCFQVHPAPGYIRARLEADRAAFAAVAPICFRAEDELAVDRRRAERYLAAVDRCDAVVCASRATARSIGRAAGGARIVPYGSKFERPPRLAARSDDPAEPIRLITVAQITQRKGLHWAFHAFARLPVEVRRKFSWKVVGRVFDPAIARLAPGGVEFIPGLSDAELASALAAADLFVMPSLIEGFGLVYIEALSLGTPVLYTEETGAADFCEDAIHGYQVPWSSWREIERLFLAIAQDPAAVRRLRGACAARAGRLDWGAFRAGVADAVEPGAGAPPLA